VCGAFFLCGMVTRRVPAVVPIRQLHHSQAEPRDASDENLPPPELFAGLGVKVGGNERASGAAGLFSGDVERSIAAGALDLVGFEVGGYFQFQAAETGQEHKLIDLSHNVADLAHLVLHPLLLFFAGLRLADGNFLLGKSGGGDNRLAVCYLGEGV